MTVSRDSAILIYIEQFHGRKLYIDARVMSD
jgi:hypothetical protein